jgi:hypothetical protein
MVLLDSFFLRYALCQSQNFFRQVTLSRELLKNCKDQTQQDCTPDVSAIAKLFHRPQNNTIIYQ